MAAAAQAEQQMEQAEEGSGKVRNENPITGAKDQWRCRQCHTAKERVRHALKSMSEDQNLGFQNMTLEERRDFYKKAQTKCGAHLQKELTESINTSTLKKISETTLEDGKFVDLGEVEEEWGEKKPEMLAQLKLHSPRMTCKYTGATLIMVPSYSFKRAAETCDSTMKVRKLQSEQCVKKIKVIKERATQEENDENHVNQNQPPGPKLAKAHLIKPITDAQQKRLDKILIGLEKTN